ncbi:MAG: UPF0147 family protein [Candidatus Diapherotrites archaeon]|nr:UPF0147 family protein [Candidatus Diapherotrites archaeon]
MKVDVKKELADAKELMSAIQNDSTVPRNIRAVMSDALNKVASLDKPDDLGVAIGTAIYLMEDISGDINMPSHTRTEIWTVISQLEAAREKIK